MQLHAEDVSKKTNVDLAFMEPYKVRSAKHGKHGYYWREKLERPVDTSIIKEFASDPDFPVKGMRNAFIRNLWKEAVKRNKPDAVPFGSANALPLYKIREIIYRD